MARQRPVTSIQHPTEFISRKAERPLVPSSDGAPELVESFSAWITRYLTLAVVGVRSEAVADKIAFYLERFNTFL